MYILINQNYIVNKFNNTYHCTIKMKPADVKLGTCIDSSKENMKKILNLNLVKSYIPKEVFVIKKVKNAVPLFQIISDFNGEETVGAIYENVLQKPNQKKFRIKKVITRKGDKLYVKQKGNDNLFNSWIDKKDIVQINEYFPKAKCLGANANLNQICLIMKLKQI